MSDSVARLNAALAGRYRVEHKLGEGGMATVYLADDLKHHRKVALKVLKPELAAVVGAERFLAEIRTTANLQHPHILPLFDSGEADGLLFYVMPRVEGESLRDRLDREHQLPVDEAVRIATNVAEALDYAHRHGVIHRDIKPANILLLDGKPLVSDFGIALALSSGSSGRLTETGLSLGTPHYMSPEQASGDESVGPATDTWALGCVLYEALVGEPPFAGSTPQAVLGKIIMAEPPSSHDARKSIPLNVDAAIRMALEKVPADRFRSAEEFARALGDRAFTHEGDAGVDPPSSQVYRTRTIAYSGWVFAALAMLLLWRSSNSEAELGGAPVRAGIPLEGFELLGGRVLDLSSDGMNLVIVARAQNGLGELWLRPMGDLTPVRIPETVNAASPRFSPDGGAIAFRVEGSIRTMSLGGSGSRTILGAGASRDLSWGADGFIYYSDVDGGISRIPAEGGDVEKVTTLRAGELSHSSPVLLPGGRTILFWRRGSTGEVDDIALARIGAPGIEVLVSGRSPAYVPTGHILFGAANGTLNAVPFDISRMEVTGEPTVVVEDVLTQDQAPSRFAVSPTGVMVYAPGGASFARGQLEWVDRRGQSEPVDPNDPPQRLIPINLRVPSVDLSKDGRRLAVAFASEDDFSGEIYVKDLPRGALERLTNSSGSDFRPEWLPDDETIAYIHEPAPGESDSVHVRTMPADGRSDGAYEVFLRRTRPVWEVSFTPRGDSVVFREGRAAFGDGDIGVMHVESGVVESLLDSNSNERAIALSPDGRWLAYVSNISGTDEVYVRPFPSSRTARVQVSRQGGREPVWGPNGRELFFREPQSGSMMAVTYTAGEDFDASVPERLFDASPFVAVGNDGAWHAYDVTADGRFAMIRRLGFGDAGPDLMLVMNFFEELRRRTAN